MFIGKMGFQQNIKNMQTNFLLNQQKSTSKLHQIVNQSKVREVKNTDTFTRSSKSNIIYSETYKGVNRLTPLTKEPITYSEIDPERVLNLDKTFSGLQDQYNYSEEDALMYQYYKKNCYHDWGFTSDKYVIDSSATEEEIKNYTMKIVEVGMNQFSRAELKETITKEELENFRKELVENGVSDDIDWWEVRSDRVSMQIGSGAASELENYMDYMCARYAVLKDRIETQYTGEEKEKNMQILNEIYNDDRNNLINSYSKDVSDFFESLGHTGVVEDIKDSLNSILDQKVAEYENYIAQNENYACISNEEDTWLYKDSSFMTAQLLKNVRASKGITNDVSDVQRENYTNSWSDIDFSERLKYNLEGNVTGEKGEYSDSVYSLEDLKFAGIYVDTMENYIRETASYSGYRNKDDEDIGKKFAQQFTEIKKISYRLHISQNLRQAIEKTYEPFLNKYIDKINEGIEKNRQNPIYGERLNDINRDVVFGTFHKEIA
ncbi:hypothetical protein [Clostridium sp. MD294]|uniref:hypothetical protein n=1 Tax=Clostridium sp. MD294 TaxID=97138 RepID=UPI0002CBC95A|nr:hypothetical protein [Clostridium sp. MD294]NDO45924.1 hypothetical protein [Clostridium sp. MD294]USF30417.1 hypothetical protein C820_001858 [Clostridium sp. MD294]